MIAGIVALCIVLLLLLYFFLIMPHVSNTADVEALRVNYAHRGLWSERIPENSLAAFAYAAQKGYGIELDVQLSKDKKIMVFHDGSLKRMCGVDRRVGEMTCEELKALRLKGSDQTIPTLAEVLALVRGRVPLMIEVKGEQKQTALCVRLARMLDSYRGAFCVISFNPLILNWFKNYRPCYARGQLVTKVTKHTRKGSKLANFFLTHMLLNFLSRPDFISVKYTLCKRPSVLFVTHALRMTGFAWTVRTTDEFRECRRRGFFAVAEGEVLRASPKKSSPKGEQRKPESK